MSPCPYPIARTRARPDARTLGPYGHRHWNFYFIFLKNHPPFFGDVFNENIPVDEEDEDLVHIEAMEPLDVSDDD